MIKIVCPACEEEKSKCEIVNVSVRQRKYEVRCPDCGKAFVVYGQDMEAMEECPFPRARRNPES